MMVFFGYCIIHLLWTEMLGFYEPFPQRQTLVGYLSGIGFFTRYWYIVPKETRIDSSLQPRLKATICYAIWSVIVLFKLIIFRGVLTKVPIDFQWMVALIVPLMKEFDDRITCKIMDKIPSPEKTFEAQVIGKIQTNLAYSYWLAFVLTIYATKATEYMLLGINFSINLWLCYKVIQLDRKVSGTDVDDNEKEKKKALTELILNEFVEVLVPVAFLGTYCIAYFGPNYDKIGNVGCKVWRFKRIERLQESLFPVAEMALIDTGSVILAGISLRWFCKINLWYEYCLTIRKYWIYMAFRGGFCISVVSINRQKIDDIEIQNFETYYMFYFTFIINYMIIFSGFVECQFLQPMITQNLIGFETMTKERNFFQILLLTVLNLILN